MKSIIYNILVNPKLFVGIKLKYNVVLLTLLGSFRF